MKPSPVGPAPAGAFLCGDDWETVGTLLRHGDPEAWNEISEAIARWEAVNRTVGRPSKEIPSDTGDLAERDDESAQGLLRRIHKRAKDGDTTALSLVEQLADGSITVNQAAIAAGRVVPTMSPGTVSPARGRPSVEGLI